MGVGLYGKCIINNLLSFILIWLSCFQPQEVQDLHA